MNSHGTIHAAVPSGGFGTPIMTVLPTRVRSRVHAATSGVGSNTAGRIPFLSMLTIADTAKRKRVPRCQEWKCRGLLPTNQ